MVSPSNVEYVCRRLSFRSLPRGPAQSVSMRIQQGLPVGAAGNEGAEAGVFAHPVAVVVELLGVFLKPCPAHGVDDGQGAVLAGYQFRARLNLFEEYLLFRHRHQTAPVSTSA